MLQSTTSAAATHQPVSASLGPDHTFDATLGRVPFQERSYQAATVARTTRYLYDQGVLSVLIEAPTGSGKTIMALMALREAYEKHGATKFVWVAMRRNLLLQAQRENVEKGFNLPITFVSMFQTDGLPDEGECDVMIVDEAHHDSCSTMVALHRRIKPKKLIGLSATPYRGDRAGLCFQKQVKEAGIYQLVREGYLASFEHFAMEKYTVDTVCETYLAFREKWGKTIMFFHRIEDCARVKAILEAAGVASEVVTATSDREAQIEAFERGEVSVLVNCMVLTEGFDCPTLSTVFVRPSSKGPTSQMAGRALRKCIGVAKHIVQCVKTPTPFTKLAPAARQWVLDADSKVWQELLPDQKIDEASRRMAKAIATAPVDMEALNSIKSGLAKKLGRRWRRGLRNAGTLDHSLVGETATAAAVAAVTGAQFSEPAATLTPASPEAPAVHEAPEIVVLEAAIHTANPQGEAGDSAGQARKAGHWTRERCLEEAVKHPSGEAWRRESRGSYNAAYRNGWYSECMAALRTASLAARPLTANGQIQVSGPKPRKGTRGRRAAEALIELAGEDDDDTGGEGVLDRVA